MGGRELIDLASRFMGMDYDDVAAIDERVGGLFVSKFLQRRLSETLAGRDNFTREAFSQFMLPGLYTETDPTNERVNIVDSAPSVNHSYPNAVTLNVTRTCHVKCTYCFRGDLITSAQSYEKSSIDTGITWIANHSEIATVVVTGGDPFTLLPAELCRLVDRLLAIRTVREIRLDTRVLTVKPSSVIGQRQVLDTLRRANGKVWLYSQINSAGEYHPDVDRAVDEIRGVGVPIVNQAVILANVNDRPELMRQMIHAGIVRGIRTDYLYLLDGQDVESPFRVPEESIRAIFKDLWSLETSGLAKPRAVYVDPLTNTKVQLLAAPLTVDKEYLLDRYLADRRDSYARAKAMRPAPAPAS